MKSMLSRSCACVVLACLLLVSVKAARAETDLEARWKDGLRLSTGDGRFKLKIA